MPSLKVSPADERKAVTNWSRNDIGSPLTETSESPATSPAWAAAEPTRTESTVKGIRNERERLATRQKTRRELFGDTDNYRLAVTQHLHLGGARHYYLRHDIEIVIETLTVDLSDNIAVHEAYVMAQLAEAITVLNVRSCDIALAVVIASWLCI